MQKAISLSLGHLASEYVGYLTSHARDLAIQELFRFVRWYGKDRSIKDLSANDIALYAQWAAPSGGEALRRLEPVKAFLAHLKKRGYTTENLSVNLKVARTGGKKAGPLSKMTKESVLLTNEGFMALQKELETLRKSRVEIAEELNKAAADKDFKENAPLDAAREHQGKVEGRIRELESILRNVVIVEDGETATSQSAKRARVGSRVVVCEVPTGDDLAYTLVNPNEASLSSGKLSSTSPTGKAILDQEEGVEIEVVAPMGTIRYVIKKIDN